jgi:hypothetical protein
MCGKCYECGQESITLCHDCGLCHTCCGHCRANLPILLKLTRAELHFLSFVMNYLTAFPPQGVNQQTSVNALNQIREKVDEALTLATKDEVK